MIFLEVDVKVVPRSSRNKVEWRPNGSLQIWTMAAPTDGQANAAVVELLATALKEPKRNIEIVRGATGRQKRLRIAGLTLEEARNRLS